MCDILKLRAILTVCLVKRACVHLALSSDDGWNMKCEV